MKATSVTVSRRFSLENYEHEILTVTADIEEGEKANEVIQKLRANLVAQHRKQILVGDNSVATQTSGT